MNKKLITIAVVIFVVIAGFIVFINSSLDKQIREDAQTTFGTVSTDKYTFYYPSSYVSATPENNEVFFYKNPNTRAADSEGILLAIQTASEGLGVANYEACERFSKNFQQSSEDKITVRVAIGQEVGEGCEITVETPVTGTSDRVITVAKYLWYPSSADNSIYSARTMYFGVASADQADILRTSVLQFTLK
ncbi:hypothetical protein CO178_01745 [candidate division WWE3 bacterium CG_4_9_14_3_um_filter_34_6]|uniref:Uncharacterized protein n=1 Tax=candidate division WWE3 bacterium CG_4_9_14_3_um_filter_34_6 TaxID=1975079 RepID=A0A2M7X3W2_UNCKA|nr:MAG: hypothetical protein CO178_01745 [candidate division WWE3 bacterium CG_4_9_14_3_um_filter_34_6]